MHIVARPKPAFANTAVISCPPVARTTLHSAPRHHAITAADPVLGQDHEFVPQRSQGHGLAVAHRGGTDA